jgi:toxin ParE1/3/4
MRFRISRSAEADLSNILRTSAERWGADACRRYGATLGAAMRLLATEPETPLSRSRNDIAAGIRSFHIKRVRLPAADAVNRPAHILFYRVAEDQVLEVVRILHERMDPRRHFQ